MIHLFARLSDSHQIKDLGSLLIPTELMGQIKLLSCVVFKRLFDTLVCLN